MAKRLRLAILTLSDRASRGQFDDTAGPTIAKLLEPLSPEIVQKAIIPDDRDRITQTLRDWLAAGDIDLLVTTGGTGLGPRDVTPEATRPLLDREIPGLAELMRWEGLKRTPMAALSRGLVGVAGRTLVLNLPGSEKAVRENLAAVMPVLPHALDVIAGQGDRHPV